MATSEVDNAGGGNFALDSSKPGLLWKAAGAAFRCGTGGAFFGRTWEPAGAMLSGTALIGGACFGAMLSGTALIGGGPPGGGLLGGLSFQCAQPGGGSLGRLSMPFFGGF